MAKAVSRLADRMLAATLKKDVAGACVPENGQICWETWTYSCDSNAHIEWQNHQYRLYGCTGTCGSTIHSVWKQVGPC